MTFIETIRSQEDVASRFVSGEIGFNKLHRVVWLIEREDRTLMILDRLDLRCAPYSKPEKNPGISKGLLKP
jgi:hypothetical protein